MKKLIYLLSSIIILVIPGSLFSLTIVPGPNVSGVWDSIGSPYIVTANVSVNGTLRIQPGVTVKFQAGGLIMEVGSGDKLIAKGTYSAPIIFEPYVGTNIGSWGGIRFNNSSQNDTLDHCIIRFGTYGVYSTNSSPKIYNSSIYKNANHGAYLFFEQNSQNPLIKNCRIYENIGSGIQVKGSSPASISPNIVTLVDHCSIYNNGVNGVKVISETFISLFKPNVTVEISNSTIVGNLVGAGAGYYNPPLQNYGNARVKLVNSIVAFNINYGVENDNPGGVISPSDIIYSSFWSNGISDFRGISGTGFGQPGSNVNLNGDHCDVNYNIFSNPLLLDTLNNNFQLKECSPCVDAGTNIVGGQFVLDPDGTMPDIGAIYSNNNISPAPTFVSIIPNSGGNTGFVTSSILGTGLTANTLVYLVNNGGDTIPSNDSLTFLVNCGQILATFNLNNQPVGFWDVIAEIPNDTLMVIPNGFEIIQGVEAEPWVNLIGFSNIRANTWQTYTVNYGNHGNVDAEMVPLYIAVPQNAEIELLFDLFEPDSNILDYDTIPIFVPVDTIAGQPFEANVYPLIIPNISPGQVGGLQFRIKVPHGNNQYRLAALVGKPMHKNRELLWDVASCIEGLAELGGLGSPHLSCIKGVMQLFDDLIHLNHPDSDGDKIFGSLPWNIISTSISCASSVHPAIMLIRIGTIITIGQGIGSGCTSLLINAIDAISIFPVSAFDPNEKIGSSGFGTSHYISGTGPYLYQIHFENMDTATASAQTVFIIDTLDKQVLDLTSLQINLVSFGSQTISFHPNTSNFQTDYDLRTEQNIVLRVKADLNQTAGVLTVKFQSLDPETYQPVQNPLIGFLPPNVSAPEGEGYISFSVRLKQGIPTGTVVKNRAHIIFDNNSPIVTNYWENITDTDRPLSHVKTLQSTQTNTSFEVKWTGSDIGSGILDYSIYVSVDSGSYYPWIINISDTSAIFDGQPNTNYRFYSIARDTAYNRELPPNDYDATTQLLTSIEVCSTCLSGFKYYPNPVTDHLSIEFILPKDNTLALEMINILGERVVYLPEIKGLAGPNEFRLATQNLSSGIYLLKINTLDNGEIVKKIIKY